MVAAEDKFDRGDILSKMRAERARVNCECEKIEEALRKIKEMDSKNKPK